MFDTDKDVMLDIKGSSVANVKVNAGQTATIGGIINSVPGSNTTVTVDIAAGGIMTADGSSFSGYGASNVAPGNYSLLSAINFIGPTQNVGAFIIKADNFNSPVKFTNSPGSTGVIILGANGIVLSGNIGASNALADIEIAASPNSSTTFTGNIYSRDTDGIRLGAGSIIEFKGNNYIVNFVRGAGTFEGTLKFTNGGAVTLSTNAGAGNNLNNVVVDGSTAVTLIGIQGIDFKNLQFTGTAGTPMLTLAAGNTIDNYAIKSISSTTGARIPELRFSGVDQDIANNITVGDATNLIKFRFMDATANPAYTFTVNQANFYGQITTNVNNVGGAVLNAASGKVYGLGESGKMLATAVFAASNVTNFGDTYAKNVTINDGNTATLSGIVSGGSIKIGDSNAANATTLQLSDKLV